MATNTKQRRLSMTIETEDQKQDPNGYNIDIFKDKSIALQYQCMICKQICDHPVELSCGDDEDDDSCIISDDNSYSHDVLYCESCLSLYLSNNNNNCPINSNHLNIKYNTARNIRKQINNLFVYCHNKQITTNHNLEGHSGCNWIGKLCKLSTHLNVCKYKTYCNICNILCIENDIIQHNKIYIIKHITLLNQKLININSDKKDNKNIELTQSISNLSSDFTLSLQHEINDLKSENIDLKDKIKCMKQEFNEWKISYSIESTKKELKLKKQLKKHNESIELLQKQLQQIQFRSESQNVSISKLNIKNATLQTQMNKIYNKTIYSRDSVRNLNIDNDNNNNNNNNNNDNVAIGSLLRHSSTRYFHPFGIERYHPKEISYEMYHPKKAKEVWVSKTFGQMSKIYRYPCCGSAKEGSIYLMLCDIGIDKKLNEPLYIVGEKNKIPQNWNNKMHLGCTKNNTKSNKNMSYYLCCDGSIVSIGCKKRYKCCKKDVGKSKGCKKGWGC